jgi:peptide/nickel transport system substrate-binding protein
MDAVIERLVVTTDRAERGKLFREVQEIAARDVPTIPLYIQPNVDIWNKKFRGFQTLEYGGSTLFSLEKVWQETP